jgi:uroporphyrinogen III methyltransferase/synthase
MTDTFNLPGIVYLVGAGPGHPGLITRWGYDLLQHCDAVAYDALIPMELIAELPETVERHYVGKRAGKHSMPQPKINELLVKLARRGLNVVRLKGGDPFIFGRSGEEAEHLTASGIPVVIVPGVTAASAAAAMSGFSLTNRNAASWVFLGTGHGAENSAIPVPWDQVAALSGGTLVIYMGLAKLDQVVAQLISSGLAPETPAIVVQAASTGIQRSVDAPLAGLSLECERRGLKPPALVVIGDTVRYRYKGTTAETEPLAGKTVLVTSPAQSTDRICRLLRKRGAEPIPYPTVTRKPAEDTEGWKRFQQLISSRGLCLFTGEMEVSCFLEGLLAHGLDMRSLGRFKILALGSSAQSALLERGIKADEFIEHFDQPILARCLLKMDPDKSLPLIRVCGDSGGGLLDAALRGRSGEVLSLTVCRNSTASWEPHWKHELIEKPPDYIAFTGIDEVEGFVELLGVDVARHLTGKSRVAALGHSVTEMLSKHGLAVDVKTTVTSIEDFIQVLAGHLQKHVEETVISRVR